MTINAWVQNHDFTSSELDEVTLEQAVSMLEAYDWDAQVEQFETKLNRREEVCPAGVAFNEGDNLLHICRDCKDDFLIHVTLVRPGRILGLLPKPAYNRSFRVEGFREAMSLLEMFFSGKYEDLRVRAH